MFILEEVPLANYSAMKLGGKAKYLKEITTKKDIAEALEWATKKDLSVRMIGSGSNIIWTDEGYSGLVLINKIEQFEIFKEDDENLYVTIGAGEDWDGVVEKIVDMGYSGVEQLSLIPGTAGATPLQNVGAYGREISEVLVSIEAYDSIEKKWMTIPAADCEFGYRTSRFKTKDAGRFYIGSITLHITKTIPLPPFYPALQNLLDESGVKKYTPKIIRDAVINIRSSKLPDIKKIANNGSFFTNPIISQEEFAQIRADFPDLPHWQLDNKKVKLSAASLIDKAGFKDFHDAETGMATWKNQSLVFVNEHAKSIADLNKFRDKIVNKVTSMFGIILEQEPETINP